MLSGGASLYGWHGDTQAVAWQLPFTHPKPEGQTIVALARVQLCPLPGQPLNTTHLVPEEQFVWFGQPLWMKRVPLAQKPSPLTVLKHLQPELPRQPNLVASGAPHLLAQWQFPCSSGMPPFLRHLLRALRVRASACLGITGISAAPSATPPSNLSARLLERAPSSRPLARSSKNCSPIVAFPFWVLLK
jgi:hypothetical protein